MQATATEMVPFLSGFQALATGSISFVRPAFRTRSRAEIEPAARPIRVASEKTSELLLEWSGLCK
jgi:hypothetical protein